MDLSDYSNFQTVLNRAKYYYEDKVLLLPSTRKTKSIWFITHKLINIYTLERDYTKYMQIYDLKTANKHRMRYLNRAVHIKGDWRDNPYSPNYLSMLLLWQF